jgi:hypothetical protein
MMDGSRETDEVIVPRDVHDMAKATGLGDYEAVPFERETGGETRLIFKRPGGYREEDRDKLSAALVDRGLPQSERVGLLSDGSHLHVDIPNQRESTGMRQALMDAGHEGVEMQTGRTITRLMVKVGESSVPDTLKSVTDVLSDKGHVITNAVLLDHVVAVDFPTMERLQRIERGRTAMADALERFQARSERMGGVLGQAASLVPGDATSSKGLASEVDATTALASRAARQDRSR